MVILIALLLGGCQPGQDQAWRTGLEPVPEVSLARREPGDIKRLSALRQRIEQTLAQTDLSAAEAARAYAELGRQYMAHEFERAALVAFANVLAIDPDWRTAHYLRAVLLQHAGQLAQARSHLLESLRIDPDDGNTLLRLGDVALAEGDPATARAYFERAMAIPLTRLSGQAGIGRSAFFARDYDTAVTELSAVLEQRPQASALRHPLAQSLRELGQIEAAKVQLAQAGSEPLEQVDPLLHALAELVVGSRALLSRAYAAKTTGDALAAERLFRAAVDQDPKFALAHAGLGQLLADQGRYAEALAAYQRAVELDPAFPEGWFNVATAHLKLDDAQAAEIAYRRVLDLNPEHSEARFALAGIFHRRGDIDAARSELEQMLRVDPINPQALQSLVMLAAAGEQSAQARQWLASALALPSEPSQRSILLVLRAHLASSSGDNAAAAADYGAALQADPENFEAWFNLAQLQYNGGARDDAQQSLARALALRPEHQQTRLSLARAQMAQGQWQAAKQTLEAGELDFRADNEILAGLIELLAASPDASVRDGERALRLAEQATRETRNLRFMELTAMAAAEYGEYEQAVQLIERLLQAAQAQSAPAAVEQRLQSALRAYSAKQPPRMDPK